MFCAAVTNVDFFSPSTIPSLSLLYLSLLLQLKEKEGWTAEEGRGATEKQGVLYPPPPFPPSPSPHLLTKTLPGIHGIPLLRNLHNP